MTDKMELERRWQEQEAALFAAHMTQRFKDADVTRCRACEPTICWENELTAKHWLTWQAARRAQADKTDGGRDN